MEHTANGLLLVDKAAGWTSHDIVAKSRRALGTRKVGHAGTLDPMATGLLVLGAGPATRLLTHLVGLDKVYRATIRLGWSTVTDDREGDALFPADAAAVRARLEELLREPDAIAAVVAEHLTGNILQAPSAVSAIKVDGKRAYDRVRAGEQVELKRRPVTIHRFEISEPRWIEAELAGDDSQPAALDIDATVHCSTGTYIRALARDLGELLGVGGHLTELRRESVGPFTVADAVHTEVFSSDEPVPLMTPADVAARLFPVLDTTAQQAIDLAHGKRLEGLSLADAPLVAAVSPEGALIALIEVKKGRGRVVTGFPQPQGQPQAQQQVDLQVESQAPAPLQPPAPHSEETR